MNVICKYTLNHIKNNKKSTISIIISITIAAILISSVCIYLTQITIVNRESYLKLYGNWHSSFYKPISGDKLKYITANPDVNVALIQSSPRNEKLSISSKQNIPYIRIRKCNKEYFDYLSMTEINKISEGRLPEKSGELAISERLINHNPNIYKIGDTITLKTGERKLNDKILDSTDNYVDGETFSVIGENTYTIVGFLDTSYKGSYVSAGYLAVEFMGEKEIVQEDNYTIKLNMKNPHKVYTQTPKIAQNLGLEKDSLGNYPISYNVNFLNWQWIIAPSEIFSFETIVKYITYAFMVLVVMVTFIFIIYNSFSLSINVRIHQLGMFKSIGATPKQIRNSVIYEGILLSIIPIIIGTLLGQLFCLFIVKLSNITMAKIGSTEIVKLYFSIVPIIISIMGTFIVAIISSYMPAKKVARLLPIDATRNNNLNMKLRKQKNHRFIKKLFGFEGELAMNTLEANKRSFRTAVISLGLCFSLMAIFFISTSFSNSYNVIKHEKPYHNIHLSLSFIDELNKEIISGIGEIKDVKEIVTSSKTRGSTVINTSQLSDEIKSMGFGYIERLKSNGRVSEEGNNISITSYLQGMDNVSFDNYCKKIGADPEIFYDTKNPKAIFLNKTVYGKNKYDNKAIEVPFLDSKQNKLTLTETYDLKSNVYDIEIGYSTTIEAPFYNGLPFTAELIVPMTVYEAIVSKFSISDNVYTYEKTNYILTDESKSEQVENEIKQICSDYINLDNFNLWSNRLANIKEYEQNKLLMIEVSCIGFMFAFIGISNIFFTISGNLQLRKRDFAILRSVGLNSMGINKMLQLESIFLALKPIIIAIPIIIIFTILLAYGAFKFTLKETIIAFPFFQIIMCVIIMVISIFVSSWVSARHIKNENIIDSIKDETI